MPPVKQNPNRLCPQLNLPTILGTKTAPFFAFLSSGSVDYQRLTAIWEPPPISDFVHIPASPKPAADSAITGFSRRPPFWYCLSYAGWVIAMEPARLPTLRSL